MSGAGIGSWDFWFSISWGGCMMEKLIKGGKQIGEQQWWHPDISRREAVTLQDNAYWLMDTVLFCAF